MDPEINLRDVPRYSLRPLPAYRHLPFQNPHPFLDEEGHSFAEELSPVDGFEAANWQKYDEYLYAIDLFNHGFWWEAHERLKQVSLGVGRDTACGLFVQGLIQVAAGLLKHSMQEEGPARALAEMGIKNLRIGEPVELGIDVATLCRDVEQCLLGDSYPVIRLSGLRLH